MVLILFLLCVFPEGAEEGKAGGWVVCTDVGKVTRMREMEGMMWDSRVWWRRIRRCGSEF